MKVLCVVLGIALLFLLGFSQSGNAIPIFGDVAGSTEGIGNFTGELTYISSGVLTIELTNTSPEDNGGFITAFVFNNPGGMISSVSLSSTDLDFGLIGGPSFNGGIDAPPFGSFDIGASIGNGRPARGISVGNTETFTFALTGAGLDLLDEQSFVEELSDSRKNRKFFVVRLKGFDDDGSDKVPAKTVPEPGALFLLGAGLAGFLGYGIKRKRK